MTNFAKNSSLLILALLAQGILIGNCGADPFKSVNFQSAQRNVQILVQNHVFGNRLDVTQTAPTNYLQLLQLGVNNDANVNQVGQDNTTIIKQVGFQNSASVSQTGPNNKVSIDQRGAASIASVSQNGTGANSATVLQNNIKAIKYSIQGAGIAQTGIANNAAITQISFGHGLTGLLGAD